MLQSRYFGSRKLCAYLCTTGPRGLSTTMTINTVATDPRINARQPNQQQAFSTAPSTEANANPYYRPGSSSDPSQPEADSQSNNGQRHGAENDLADSRMYVLTLLTDSKHHDCMTALRRGYFPAKLNKLASHVTLFHALPEDKLEHEIIPELESRVSQTKAYRIQATKASRLNKGVAIDIADDIDHAQHQRKGPANSNKPRGRNMTRIIHAELRKKWSDWLSEQDSKPPKIHYTIMNKVNDEAICEKAMGEVNGFLEQGSVPKSLMQAKGPEKFDPNESDRVPLKLVGDVLGLTLWRYVKSGHWIEPRHFEFAK